MVASDLNWNFTAIPDRPPTIALTKEPEPQSRGALQLTYKLEDDYGVVGANATFKLKNNEGTNGDPPRPLYEHARISRYRCRRRAPRTAPARPPRT